MVNIEVRQVGICYMKVSQAKSLTLTSCRVVEVVSNADRDLTGRVALIRLVVSINTQHLHSSLPPGHRHTITCPGEVVT